MAADLVIAIGTFPTPIGPLAVATSPDGVIATSAGNADELATDLTTRLGAGVTARGRLTEVRRDLRSYLAGRGRELTMPVDLRLVGTPFALAVLTTTTQIPYGELWTYGDVAGKAGRPRAARAAGSVLRTCPIELWVPCHRVVPAGPGLGTYGGEDDRRGFLLRHEGAI